MKRIASGLTTALFIAAFCLICSADCLGQGVVTRRGKNETKPENSTVANPATPTKQATKKAKNESDSPDDAIIARLIENMVEVEGGTFMMGCEDSKAQACEKPVHAETVSSFRIGKYEVTQAEWKAVMGSNPSFFNGDKLPVEQVSWDDCQEFIRKLNQKTGMNFRLPTEAEWEYAARGGNRTHYYKYSGSNDHDAVAWVNGNSGNGSHPVGTKAANELGLYDMSGNVCEWTSDLWCDNYGSSRTGSLRVYRGGCWSRYPARCRVTNRGNYEPSHRYDNLGLRLALSL